MLIHPLALLRCPSKLCLEPSLVHVWSTLSILPYVYPRPEMKVLTDSHSSWLQCAFQSRPRFSMLTRWQPLFKAAFSSLANGFVASTLASVYHY